MDIIQDNKTIVKNFRAPIIYTRKLVNSTYVIIDSSSNIRYLDSSTLETLNGFKAGIKYEWYKNNVVSFSQCGNYFATVSSDARFSILYNANTKKTIAKVERHHGGVSCVAVDRRGKYFFSCGEDGKIFVVDIKTAKLSFTLPHHADAVNDIVFSENNQLVATASYDKKISIFNYAIMTPIATLKAHNSAVMKIHFLSDNRLFSIDKQGSAIIWDLNTKKVITRLSGIHDDIREVTANDKFLFLGSNLGFILVYDLDSYDQIERNFIKLNSTITSLDFDSTTEKLIVGCEDGELNISYIYRGLEHLNELLKDEEYEAMFEHVESNPILKYTEPYIVLSTIWDKTLVKATELLQSAQNVKATELFAPFKNVPSKKTIIKKLLQEYSEFDKFIILVKNGNVALAYSLARKHPSYKKSKIYQALEDRWRKLFARAQVLALESAGKDKVNELLSQYRGVIEKSKHIQEMIAKSEKFIRFQNAIAKKDFKIAFELAKVNPFLTEFKEYNSLITYGDALYIKVSRSLKDSDFHDSIKLLRILIDFPDFESEAKSMIKDIENQGKFLKAVEEDDMKTAYSLLDKSLILSNTQAGKKLNKKWEEDFDLAEVHAIKGDITSIDAIIQHYENIGSKNMAIVSIYALAYINQIENAIEHKKHKDIIEKGFKSYIINFGLDDYIVSTFEIFEKEYGESKLNLESLKKGSRAMWRTSMRVKNILDN